MKKNVRKPPAADARDAGRKPDVAPSDDRSLAGLTKTTPGPVREDSENLRQRGEWFSRRSGGK